MMVDTAFGGIIEQFLMDAEYFRRFRFFPRGFYGE
jgi:hypothetical protein